MIYKNGYIECLEEHEQLKLSQKEIEEKFQEFLSLNNLKFHDIREKYELDRMPIGCAHTFSSNYPEQIYDHLRSFICNTCFENKWCDEDDTRGTPDISDNHEFLPVIDKIYELLSTPCGAEWMFTIYKDVDGYDG